MVIYLGEENGAGTLPTRISGAVSLGNPFKISKTKRSPGSYVIAKGIQKYYFENRRQFLQMTDTHFQTAHKKVMYSILQIPKDGVLLPHLIHNEPTYPFLPTIGYDIMDQFYNDACSYRQLPNIKISFLILAAQDDFVIRKSNTDVMNYALKNPNVIWVESKTGGHLGWFTGEGIWSDWAICDFVKILLNIKVERLSVVTEKIKEPRNMLKHDGSINKHCTQRTNMISNL